HPRHRHDARRRHDVSEGAPLLRDERALRAAPARQGPHGALRGALARAPGAHRRRRLLREGVARHDAAPLRPGGDDMPERFTSKRWLSFFFGWLLLLLVLQGAHAYFSRQTA